MERIATSQFTIGMLLQATFFAALAASCIVLPINVGLRANLLAVSSGALVGTFARKAILGAVLALIAFYSIMGFAAILDALSRGILY